MNSDRKKLALFPAGYPNRSASKRRIMNRRKLLKKILDGSKNIRFADMVNLVKGFGFELED